MGGKKNAGKSGGLGKSIIKKRFGPQQQHFDVEFSALHTTDIDEKAENSKKLQSVTQMTDLEEFLQNADLAEKEFTAEKQNMVIMSNTSYRQELIEPEIEREKKNASGMIEWNALSIPRRPYWDKETTPAELKLEEKQTFLEWRRSLSKLEEESNTLLTPFEKNLEVWRQLWRVIERSDVVVQIVDARNPLLFRCTDLEKYVKEVDKNKKNILLINKADLLTMKQRYYWAKFFVTNAVDYVFFSANFEELKLQLKREQEQNINPENVASTDDSVLAEISQQVKQRLEETQRMQESDNEEEQNEHEEEEEEQQEEEAVSQPTTTEVDVISHEKPVDPNIEPKKKMAKIFTREELLNYLLTFQNAEQLDAEGNPRRLVVGMVGYPNVGKSSTINVLVGEKKVAVAPTPGKTKHFQTINIDERICLCDCPGLVFPTFMTTKADMVCNGLLAVDHLREYRGPIALVSCYLPESVLHVETTYGIVLQKPGENEDPSRPPTPEELLQPYAKQRGFMTAHGAPNEAQAARQMLRDYMVGKLLYIYPPPGMNSKVFNKNTKQPKKVTEQEQQQQNSESTTESHNEKDPQHRDQRPKRKKKAHKKHTEPTIKENPDFISESFVAKQNSVSAHTTGKMGNGIFTRTKFSHSPIPVQVALQHMKATKASLQ